MWPCLAGDGWETAVGTVAPPASLSVKKVMAAKMNVGREMCIQNIYVMKFMGIVTVASGGFCPFVIFN